MVCVSFERGPGFGAAPRHLALAEAFDELAEAV